MPVGPTMTKWLLSRCESAWGPDADRHTKLLINREAEGSLLEAYLQSCQAVILAGPPRKGIECAREPTRRPQVKISGKLGSSPTHRDRPTGEADQSKVGSETQWAEKI